MADILPVDAGFNLKMGRRAFLFGGAATVAMLALATPRPAQASIIDLGLAKKTIAGYTWPWTGRPGESIAFKVSTYAPGDYTAEIVRLICADAITDGGRHFKEEPVAKTGLAKRYPGRNQPTFMGSFAHIEDVKGLTDGQSFTLALSLYPTSVIRGTNLSASSFAPLSGKAARKVQHVVSRWREASKTGWSLVIDEMDRPTFYVGDGSGAVDKVTLPDGLVLRRWVKLSVAYDAASGRVTLLQTPVYRGAGDRSARAADRAEGTVRAVPQKGALRFGAAVGGPSNTDLPAGAGLLNGKLDKVRLAKGALDDAGVRKLHAAADTAAYGGDLIAWWDFTKGIGTTKVHDIAGGADGVTVNLPLRAVIGVDFTGKALDWKDAPQQYSALYFHDDALSDAEWKTDFEFKIPKGLRSGMYAAKLKHGASEAYVPFYVAPDKAKPKAKVAFVVPTLTYLAYSSAIGHSYWTRRMLVNQPGGGQKVTEEEWMPIYIEEKTAVDMAMEFGPSFGMGVYRFYSDGAPVHHAPMRIPNMANQPKALLKNTTADTDIIEWLEHEGADYDVITDELIHEEGVDLLNGYSTVITGSHTEYHTWEMYNAFVAYTNGGGRLMSIGGNGFHNRVAFHREVPGVIECRKKQGGTAEGNDYFFQAVGEFDGLPTGKFKELGSPANVLHGIGTVNLEPMTAGTYYKKMPGADDPRAAFALAGVGKDEKIGNFGKSGGGAASEEIDSADLKDGTPAHALILATASDMVWPMVSEDGLTDPKYRLEFSPHADVVFFETPGGGAVFSVGSMGWRASLSHNGFDNNVARITRNVLARFTDPKPFQYPA